VKSKESILGGKYCQGNRLYGVALTG